MNHTVHVLGNSHVRNFIGGPSTPDKQVETSAGDINIIATQLGATGATIFGLENGSSLTSAGTKITGYVAARGKLENVLMVLGDVDIRVHSHRHVESGNVEKTMRELVDRYERFILTNIAGSVSGKTVVAECVPFARGFYETCCQEYPTTGYMTMYCRSLFCYNLELACHRNGWSFLTYPDHMSDRFGFMKDEYRYSDDPKDIHMKHDRVFLEMMPRLRSAIGG